MKIYHYAPGMHSLAIITSGYIDTTPKQPRGFERAVAWFTTMNEFPPTAWKPINVGGELRVLTPDEMAEYLGGIFRFSVDESAGEFHEWQLLKSKARMPKKIRARLAKRAAMAKERTETWRGCLTRVPTSMLSLEMWDGSTWREVPMAAESIPEIKLQVRREAIA